MNSQALGKSTLVVEITNISIHGIWLLTREKELFISYEEFPWFKDASVGKILNVKNQHQVIFIGRNWMWI